MINVKLFIILIYHLKSLFSNFKLLTTHTICIFRYKERFYFGTKKVTYLG